MANAEGLFPVREVESKESPLTKSKKKNKLKLSISPKSKGKANRKDSIESDSVNSEKDKKGKSKKPNYKESSSSESEDDQFISDILSCQPPPYHMVLPDPIAGGDAQGSQGQGAPVLVVDGINQAFTLGIQPPAPPLAQIAPLQLVLPQTTPLQTDNVEVISERTDEGASASSSQSQRPDESAQINVGILKIEFDEIVKGNVDPSRLIIYNKPELRYIIKVAMGQAKTALNDLKRAAEEYGVDISSNKHMRRAYQTEFMDEELDRMDVPSMRSNIQGLIEIIQDWSDL